jgi:hypothetical protein
MAEPFVLCGARNGCKNEARPRHSCPFQSDVNDDDNPNYCDCCEDCTHECCDDV